MSTINKFLCKVEGAGRWIVNSSTFIILFVVNPGHKFIEIKQGFLEHDLEASEFKISADATIDNLDLLLNESMNEKDGEEARLKAIDEKNKVLLTVCGLLAAATGVLFTQVSPKWLLILPMFPILTAIYLILRYFSVQGMRRIDIDEIKWVEKHDLVKKGLIEQYRQCAKFLSPRNDFRVGIYRAAYRIMFLGIALLLFVFSWSAFSSEQKKAENAPSIDNNVIKIKEPAIFNSNENDAQDPLKTTP